jgi:hypothetical protein
METVEVVINTVPLSYLIYCKKEYKEDNIPTTGDAKFVRIGKGKKLWRNFSIYFGKLKINPYFYLHWPEFPTQTFF